MPVWSDEGGYGHHSMMSHQAHHYCRAHVRENDGGYRTPGSEYWTKFEEAFYVMESEHIELGRMCKDTAALAAVSHLKTFAVTPAVSAAYSHLMSEYNATSDEARSKIQQRELVAVAEQEQMNVLQPLIYNDPLLKVTMDTNHQASRMTNGWISPKFKVIYSAGSTNSDPDLETVFDAPKSVLDRFSRIKQSLPNEKDRMMFVGSIAKDFNKLMSTKRGYMESELRKILGWLKA